MKNMRNIMIVTLFAVMACALSACSHTNMKDKKAPCSPLASAGSVPCELIPINFASLSVETKIIKKAEIV